MGMSCMDNILNYIDLREEEMRVKKKTREEGKVKWLWW